jgi:hypothetical protein
VVLQRWRAMVMPARLHSHGDAAKLGELNQAIRTVLDVR